jgi:hypothetical protein
MASRAWLFLDLGKKRSRKKAGRYYRIFGPKRI